MKKTTVNLITNLIGFLLLLAIVPVVFFVESNLAIIIPSLLVCGLILVYFKNDAAQGLVKTLLPKFLK